MFTVQDIPISEIQVMERTRKDVGDLSSLVFSIQQHGLLVPILLNEDKVLLGGERRLRAFQAMEQHTIPARILPGLNPDDCLMIEFIENHERLDFSWDEELDLKAKMHEYWKSCNSQWGYRETAEKLGVSLGGLSSDLALAEALKHFPDLRELKSKGKAKEAYKRLESNAAAILAINNLTPEEQEKITQMMERTTAVVTRSKETTAPADPTLEIPRARHASKPPQDYLGQDGEAAPVEAIPMSATPLAELEPENVPEFTYKICSYEELLPKLPDGIIGFAELDPPYAINYEYSYHDDNPEDGDWTLEQLEKGLDFIFKQLQRVMMDNTWVMLWTGYEHILWIQDLARENDFHIQHPGIWYKPNGGRTQTPSVIMKSMHEHFLLFRKGKALFNTPSFPNTVVCDTLSGERHHKWEKPIELYRKFFTSMGRAGSYFLSPFAGSGNSMITSTFFNMTPIGCDTTNKHFYRFYESLKRYHVEN